jgi:hypothetical protein
VVNLLVLVLLAILTAGAVAVVLLAGRVGEEATELVAALRGFRTLRPAVLELQDETARLRALAEHFRQGDH